MGNKLGKKSREMLTKLTGNSGEHSRVLSLFIGKKKWVKSWEVHWLAGLFFREHLFTACESQAKHLAILLDHYTFLPLPPLSSTLIKCIQTLTHHTVSCQHDSSMPDPRNQTKLSPYLHTSVDATSPHLIVRKQTLFVDDASKSTPPNLCLTLPATKCTSQIHNPCNIIH